MREYIEHVYGEFINTPALQKRTIKSPRKVFYSIKNFPE